MVDTVQVTNRQLFTIRQKTDFNKILKVGTKTSQRSNIQRSSLSYNQQLIDYYDTYTSDLGSLKRNPDNC